ncbi:uncharacterized protein MELLADRAFT_69226 [Melampsora larici-populina 98AG31]|uniref:Uncharacterized protein n=1 Tax=Melampsora larici-populina (strain 98AG31 / pathotype 3-4-7) TaxID=747676 RepID=F4S9V8_MELLP|nr:uncharacterized protein MELLADRAFT_69226 [Melampsora larici-populina 98AG31]EGF98586.1 hypothetical protein MELLADRAFT_69226 [Melampsora larici-populina 98AG31]
MVNFGPAVRHEAENNEAGIMRRFHAEIPHYVGPRDDECQGCGALHWVGERPKGTPKSRAYSYLECCHKGGVSLPVQMAGSRAVPAFLEYLLTSQDRGKLTWSPLR